MYSEPEDGRIHNLSVISDKDGNLVHFVRESGTSKHVLNIDELLTSEVVMAQAQGRDALLLSCNECNVGEGGPLRLRYLYNGITNSYKSSTVWLRHRHGEWGFFNEDGEKIVRMNLISRRIFGRLIGIDGIEMMTSFSQQPPLPNKPTQSHDYHDKTFFSSNFWLELEWF